MMNPKDWSFRGWKLVSQGTWFWMNPYFSYGKVIKKEGILEK
jgi:hypothetical protein